MKILLLLILVSCGENKVPSYLDLYDSDGDQILNHLEGGLSKYIADVKGISKIKGIITFEENKNSGIEFSNEVDLKHETLKLLTHNGLQLESQFKEWSRIKIKNVSNLAPRGSYQTIKFHFENAEHNPKSIYFVKPEGRVKLGDWKPLLETTLSSLDLNLLLSSNDHYLEMSSEWLEAPYFNSGTVKESVKNKTYRVFYHDEKETKVLYISKELDFSKFVEANGIQDIKDISKIDAFNLRGEQRNWWLRNIGEDKVLAYASNDEISQSFLKGLEKFEFKVSRINGRFQGRYNLKLSPTEKVWLKIRGIKKVRTFHDFTTSEYFPGAARGEISPETCYYYNRGIKAEVEAPISLDELIAEMNLHPFKITEEANYWVLNLNSGHNSLDFEVNDRPSNTYVETGMYNGECYRRRPNIGTVATNNEGIFEVYVEAFVEKLK